MTDSRFEKLVGFTCRADRRDCRSPYCSSLPEFGSKVRSMGANSPLVGLVVSSRAATRSAATLGLPTRSITGNLCAAWLRQRWAQRGDVITAWLSAGNEVNFAHPTGEPVVSENSCEGPRTRTTRSQDAGGDWAELCPLISGGNIHLGPLTPSPHSGRQIRGHDLAPRLADGEHHVERRRTVATRPCEPQP